MDVMLARNPDVVVFGEDVGYFGGVFRCTEGLQAKYGKTRVFDTPISEGGIVGIAVGNGGIRIEARGRDPVRRLLLSRLRPARSPRPRACAIALPATSPVPSPSACRAVAASTAGRRTARVPRRLFTHVCGLRTVLPSNPYDAKGLLISSIENDDPVIFLEPKRIYNGPFDGHHDKPVVPWSKHPMGEVPEGYYTVPLESAKVFRRART
jgi:2-oxoisovalerate dehydrogenase E1 component beta subunit